MNPFSWTPVTALATLITLGIAPTFAQAQPPGGERVNYLRTLLECDANRDGLVERDELPETAREPFDVLLKHGDLDGDQALSREESRIIMVLIIRGVGELSTPDILLTMDNDGDDQVSRSEFTGPQPAFALLDANRDGAIDRDEAAILSYESPSLKPRRPFAGMVAGMVGPGDRPRPDTAPPAGGLPGRFRPGLLRERPGMERDRPPFAADRFNGAAMLERLRRMDADGDDMVSREEFQGPPPLFDRLDRDGDGRISSQDLREAGQRLRPNAERERGPSGSPPPGRSESAGPIRDNRPGPDPVGRSRRPNSDTLRDDQPPQTPR